MAGVGVCATPGIRRTRTPLMRAGNTERIPLPLQHQDPRTDHAEFPGAVGWRGRRGLALWRLEREPETGNRSRPRAAGNSTRDARATRTPDQPERRSAVHAGTHCRQRLEQHSIEEARRIRCRAPSDPVRLVEANCGDAPLREQGGEQRHRWRARVRPGAMEKHSQRGGYRPSRGLVDGKARWPAAGFHERDLGGVGDELDAGHHGHRISAGAA
jgi:hypothetical protein